MGNTTALKPGLNISIKPITTSIGLIVRENGGGEYYLFTKENIEINSIDVKGILSGTTIVDTGDSFEYVTGWTEQNGYDFSVGEIKKKTFSDDERKYCHSVLIKLINSPYIPLKSISPLCLRLYIYYTLNGEKRRIVVDTKNPDRSFNEAPEYLIYRSNTYENRKKWAYSIQLDSIYRPFFFNAALLLFEPDIFGDGFNDISGKTYGKFYFSIANGCTLRDGQVNNLPKYKIGDINLNISFLNYDGGLDTGSTYNLTIKDNYRPFSEINDCSDQTYLSNHIRGIREYGIYNGKWVWNHQDGTTGATYGGINLPQISRDEYLTALHLYENGPSNPPTFTIYKNKNGNAVDMSDFETSQEFKLNRPLNVSFNVSDASIDGIDYKTISVDCGDIRFPWDLVYKDGKIRIPYNQYNENVTYIYIKKNESILYDIFKQLGNLNVFDYFSDTYRNDDIFNYLYHKHYGDKRKIEFTYKEGYYEASISDINYILAIYHGGYEIANSNILGEEEAKKGDLLRYINHTNKLLIMKLYNV